jgi:activator of HSP90 ATPase
VASNRAEVTFRGLDELTRRLQEIDVQLLSEAGNALRAEAEIEMTEAKRRTPVATGALRASGHVEGPEQGTSSAVSYSSAEGAKFVAGPNRGDISVRMVFGGPAAEYAVLVHENIAAFHKNGQAKFLESVLMESAPYLADRVAKRMAKS